VGSEPQKQFSTMVGDLRWLGIKIGTVPPPGIRMVLKFGFQQMKIPKFLFFNGFNHLAKELKKLNMNCPKICQFLCQFFHGNPKVFEISGMNASLILK
jgi:hypothetical protein